MKKSNGEPNHIRFSDNEDSIFASSASILVAESKQQFAGKDSNSDMTSTC